MPIPRPGRCRATPAHAGSASALMGTFQFSLGASSGLLVGLLTDGTPRGMAALMACGMLGRGDRRPLPSRIPRSQPVPR